MNTDINELFSKYGIERHPTKKSFQNLEMNSQELSNFSDKLNQTDESSDLVITQYPGIYLHNGLFYH